MLGQDLGKQTIVGLLSGICGISAQGSVRRRHLSEAAVSTENTARSSDRIYFQWIVAAGIKDHHFDPGTGGVEFIDERLQGYGSISEAALHRSDAIAGHTDVGIANEKKVFAVIFDPVAGEINQRTFRLTCPLFEGDDFLFGLILFHVCQQGHRKGRVR